MLKQVFQYILYVSQLMDSIYNLLIKWITITIIFSLLKQFENLIEKNDIVDVIQSAYVPDVIWIFNTMCRGTALVT